MNTKWLFIHIPKTGGTYFRAAILARHPPPRMVNLAHSFPYRFKVNMWDPKASLYRRNPDIKDRWYNRSFRPSYTLSTDNIEYVTIVRNPFDLFYSYWKFDPHHHLPERPTGWASCNNIMQTNTFHDFVECYLDPEKEWHIPPFKKNLFAQIYTKGGELIPKRENILRFEGLENEMIKWSEKNGLECDRGFSAKDLRKNTNPNRDIFKDKYTTLQIYKLEQLWQEQLKTFNYKYSD
jgi:hypothetical protein